MKKLNTDSPWVIAIVTLGIVVGMTAGLLFAYGLVSLCKQAFGDRRSDVLSHCEESEGE
jgi:hypothetical protein